MDQPATKDQKLAFISQGLADIEEAISTHPPETVAVYQQGRDAFSGGLAQAKESEWSRAAGLSLSDLTLTTRYFLASAFISAWHAVRGDKARRNQATSPACLLVSAATGLTPEDVLNRFMQYEQVWCTALKPKKRWWFW